MDTLNELWTIAEARRRARAHDEYRRRVGAADAPAVEADEASWPTADAVRDLSATLRVADDAQVLGLRQLLRFTTGEYILRQTQRLATYMLTQQQTALVEVPILDEAVPLWQISSRLARERKRVLREALDDAAIAVIRGFSPRHRELWTQWFATIEALGYATPLALWETLSGVSLDAFLKPLEAILRDTEDTYRERMQWHLKRALGVPLDAAKRHDILALFGRDETAAWFPRAEMIPCLDTWVHEWGWRFEEHANLHFEPYSALPGGACCAALEIPGDIRLAVAAADGLQGYAQAWREVGKALLLASFPAEAAGALRCFPDPSLLESQAELFGSLTRTPRWVQIYRHVRQPAEALNLAQLERLFIVRRYIGKCLYERTFYEDSNLEGKEEAYRDAMRRACGFTYPEVYYLFDIEPNFAAFWQTRGWLLGAHLRQQASRLYAEEWFREADALQALQEFWGRAPYHTVETLIAQVGGAAANVDPVVSDLLSDL
jgi:hypothetical protein